ncbi:DUF5063 domain-containing protein [Hymenobacter sp. ASUV-10]|uniref:DUF5063 domain-containing protein n=1 Tax=Hymenobacter aranciens TaxID=3063996 RepID=A0ABT9B761_9BACT|nr:DUF5063 domain-containing protein [Hymenobacter sp. ASUV-10]MDO7874116.1 DUF5063 domain-containing protein [Hymenobacter sp. ASUV-10]
MKCIPIAEAIGTEKLRQFIVLARRYCALIEAPQPVAPEAFLPEMQQVLAVLYAAALRLDWIDLQSNVDYEVAKIDLQAILVIVAEKVGDNRYYWNVFDPTDMTDEPPVCYDLLDDLGDIYKDLQYSLRVFDLQTADSQENAVWGFNHDFSAHWGQHCINAMRALHFFVQKLEKN